MLFRVLVTILHVFLLIHTTLYQPRFAPLPIVRAYPLEPASSFTLPIMKLTATQIPPIQAGAFLVIDMESAEVLAEKNADRELPPASTTKIMTAIIALEHMDQDEIITVPDDVPREGSVMKLVPGEHIRTSDVIMGMLIHSSNDASEVLARTFPGGSPAFIAAMNQKAQDLGMIHTHYKNPSGLYEADHVMTVRDLLILSRYAMKNGIFAAIVAQQQADIHSVDGKYLHQVETTNQLLGTVPGVEGIKTGYTQEAGECLVTQVTRDGHTVLTALLGSTDRFAETKTLISWVYDGFTWDTKTPQEWAAR